MTNVFELPVSQHSRVTGTEGAQVRQVLRLQNVINLIPMRISQGVS